MIFAGADTQGDFRGTALHSTFYVVPVPAGRSATAGYRFDSIGLAIGMTIAALSMIPFAISVVLDLISNSLLLPGERLGVQGMVAITCGTCGVVATIGITVTYGREQKQ